MKIALLTIDNRDHFRDYTRPVPVFGSAPAALIEGFSGMEDVELYVLSCQHRLIPSPEKLAGNVWFHGLPVPWLGWMKTGFQGCIRAVRRALRQLQPDIVHGQGTERDCAVSAVLSGFPNVVTIHGNMRQIARLNRAAPFSHPWLAARLEGWTLPRAGGVVCITDYTRRQVAPLNPRTWVVPNAVGSPYFGITRAPETPPFLLCAGVIEPRKNQIRLIEALDPLQPSLGFQLLFAGLAPRGRPPTQNSSSMPSKAAPGAATWAWSIPTPWRHLLTGTFLSILPSTEDNCPMVVLEAMAAGVPVAAARVGGVPELIREGVTGRLFDPGDPDALRRAVRLAFENGPGREAIAAAARREAERFRPAAVAQRHLEIYRAVLKNQSRV